MFALGRKEMAHSFHRLPSVNMTGGRRDVSQCEHDRGGPPRRALM